MKLKTMKPISRILIALSSLSMLATFYLPLWQIQLWAPQYPEGLNMKIWHNHLSGAFDIINGLNHYIGMRLIKEEMFPELKYIGILIGIYIAIGVLTAITNKLSMLKIYTFTGIVYGVAALYDFYRWGYDYGHNLDPHAAIQVPGMSYQPPVIGYKNLLNFTAYSGPDKGGWIIVIASVVAFCVLVYTIWSNKKAIKNNSISSKAGMSVASLLSIFLFSACNSAEPAPIRLGKDECTNCKMIITDPRFGAEIITKTNKLFKFDDVNCLNNYIKNNEKIQSQINHIYFVDYGIESGFVLANQAFYLQSEEIKSPMGSAVAAFSNQQQLTETASKLTQSQAITWKEASKVY
jgi:copper chaperone NosL